MFNVSKLIVLLFSFYEQLGMKPGAISSNLPSVEVQDDFEASFLVVLIKDDDCESEELMVSHHNTKWIIYGDE